MYVTTNLPVTKKWTGKVFVVPLDNARSVLSVRFSFLPPAIYPS